MRQRRFIQCDVFSPIPTQGNGLAVVLDAEDLSDAQLQGFAAWTNLAETTFLFPPSNERADYRVRIFTPSREMLFAGHPTLGSCAAWLHAGGSPRQPGLVRQECGVGIVDIDVKEPSYAFVAPPTKIAELPAEQLDRLQNALGLKKNAVMHSALLDNGPVWQVLQLQSAAQVLAVDSTRVAWPDYASIGLIGAHPPGSECDYEVRMLAPSSGMREDPITGSLNAALAHWLQSEGRMTEATVIAQGTKIQRYGRVSIRPHGDGRMLVGGDTHIVIDGAVSL